MRAIFFLLPLGTQILKIVNIYEKFTTWNPIKRTEKWIDEENMWHLQLFLLHLSRVMRKPDFCICENKGADQLRSNCAADQHLCFRYVDSTIPLLSKSQISSL